MKRSSPLSFFLLLLLAASASAAANGSSVPAINTNILGTRSIAACDPVSLACGVAVVSFPVTSSTIPYGKPGVVVAYQMFPSVDGAQAIMAGVEAGATPRQALDAVLAVDPIPAMRQVGVVSVDGAGMVRVAQHTGAASWTERCTVAGATYAVQASGQTSPEVCQAMAQGFEQATGSLALRLLAALKAGAAVGQDIRGERSATLRVWSGVSPISPLTHLLADASVSGKADALGHLETDLFRYLGQVAPPDPADFVRLDEATVRGLKTDAQGAGLLPRLDERPLERRRRERPDGAPAQQRLHPPATVEHSGARWIDVALAQFILRAEPGTLVRSPR